MNIDDACLSVTDGVVETMENFLIYLQDCASPFEFASSLVKATAQSYNADIATFYRVNLSKSELVSEAGYDQKGQELKAQAIYPLNWQVKTESEMPGGGITAWVAVSGEPLFIKNAEELLDKNLHPAHKGAWDLEVHPEGANKTFGCLYAAPLRLLGRNNEALPPEQSVLGVYKIERRKDNPKGVFTKQQLKEFDLAARQLTLVIILYERAMSGILSDANHAVHGRLADVKSQLEMMSYNINKLSDNFGRDDVNRILEAIEATRQDTSRVLVWLGLALHTYSNPMIPETRSLERFAIDTTISVRGDIIPQWVIGNRDDTKRILELNLAESWDLHTLLLSLLNNALQHSGKPGSVLLQIKFKKSKNSNGEDCCIFIASDEGQGIRESIIKESRNASKSLEPLLNQASGTGLKRVFRVIKARQWKLKYEPTNPGSKETGATFFLTVPLRKKS